MDRQRFADGSGGDRDDDDDDDDDDGYDDDNKDLREYFFKLFSNRSVYDVFESPFRNSTPTGSTAQRIAKAGQELLTNSNEPILSNLTTLSSDWTIDQTDPCFVLSGINHTLGNVTFWDNSSYPHEGWIGHCNLSTTTTNHGEVVVPMDLWQVVLFSTLAGCTSLITVVGNLIVLLSFIIERSIRQPTNYFIASLAVSDLIIGSISMPFYTLYLVAGQRWNLGPNLCDLWLSIDYTVCLASIYTVFCITIDRFCSVTIPAKYRDWRTERKVLVIIATTWIIPILVFFVSIFGWQYIVGERTVEEGKCYVQYMDNPIFNCFLQVGYFWITLIIMFILYTCIYRVALRMAAKSEQKYKKMTTLVSVAGQTMTTIGMNIGHRASLNPDSSQQNQKHETNCLQNSRLVTMASVTSSSTTDDRKASAVPPLPDQPQRPPGTNDPHHLHPGDFSTREVMHQPPSSIISSDGNSLASNNPQEDGVECLTSTGQDGFRLQATLSPDDERHNSVIPSVKFEDQTLSCSSDNACEPLGITRCSSGSHPCLSKCEKDCLNPKTPDRSCTDEKPTNNSNCSLGVYESRRETSDDDEADTSRLIQRPVNCPNLEEGKKAVGLCQAAVSSDTPACEEKNDDPFSFPSPKTYRKQFKNGDKASLVHQSPDTPKQNISASAHGTRVSDKSTEKHYRPAKHDGVCPNKHGSKTKSKESIGNPKNKFFLNFRNREYFRQKRKQQLKNSASNYSQQKQQDSRLKVLKRYFSESDARRGQRTNSTKSTFSEKFFRSGSEISKQSRTDVGRGTPLKGFMPLCFGKKATSIVITPAGTSKKRSDHSGGGRNKSENRARKALRTITIILGAFVVCWTPWHVLSLIIGFKGDQLPAVISGLLYDISYWLCYLNSPINPFCYALANQQFKKAFSRILKLHWHRT